MAKIDKDLIFLYAEDARAKIKQMAGLLKKSPQRLKYNITSLEKEWIINNPYCIFDYSRFGLILFKVYFKGAYIGENDKADIIKKLIDNQYVVAMYELSGEFDFVIEIVSPNPSRFNKVLKNAADLSPTLTHYKVILNLVTFIYPRIYLTKKNQISYSIESSIIIGGDREIESFSENEMAVMNGFLENPKIRYSSLARESGLNIKTVQSVTKNLCNKKIIRGFKYVLDTNKLGFYKLRLFLKLHNLNKERETELMSHMKKTKEIVQVNKTVGDWDLEIDIESPDKGRVRKLTLEIREHFKELIENFNMIEIYQYYKRAYLPKYLFEKDLMQK